MRSSCSTGCSATSLNLRGPASTHCCPVPTSAELIGRWPQVALESSVVSRCRRYCCAVSSDGYTNDELAAMMVDLESDLVERKRALSSSAIEKVSRSICALANDLPGHGSPGVIFVGVEDNGRCAGLRIDDRLLQRLAALRDDGRLLPLPSMDVQRRTLEGCEVAVITVQPASHPPVRHDGRVWVRVGPTVRQASASDEQRLTERRRSTDLPFDLRPAHSATVNDLDLDFIENHYLPKAVSAEVLAENRRTLSEQMRSLRLLSGDDPTNGAMLAFGREPQWSVPGAYVQFVRFDGNEITDPIRTSERITGRLNDVLNGIDRLLRLSIQTRLDIVSGSREERFPDYPVEALRQLAYNAIMHRSYEGTNAPTRLYWFSDRVWIESPGGLYGRVTKETLLEGATDYRNGLIAEVMRNLGFAQNFGLGIPLAREALRANGNPEPEFDVQHTWVRATIRLSRPAR